jgi:hypothetical protein
VDWCAIMHDDRAVTLTGGDRNDVTRLIPPLEAVAPIRGKRGRSLSPDAAPDTAPASESTAGW